MAVLLRCEHCGKKLRLRDEHQVKRFRCPVCKGVNGNPVQEKDPAEAKPELLRFYGAAGPVWSVACSPCGRWALAGGWDRTVRLYDLATGRECRRFAHGEEVASVAFSPDGRSFLAAEGWRPGFAPGESLPKRDQSTFSIRIWDLAKEKELHRLEQQFGVNSAAFSPNGRQVVFGGQDKMIHLWDLQKGKVWRRVRGHSAEITGVVFSADGRWVLSASASYGKDMLCLWDTRSSQELRPLEGCTGPVHSVAFAPDGRRFLSAGGGFTRVDKCPVDCFVRLWELESGKEIKRLGGWFFDEVWSHSLHAAPIHSVVFSPDGKMVLSASGFYQVNENGDTEVLDCTVRAWQVSTGAELGDFGGHGGPVTSVAFAPDGGKFLSASADGSVRLWNLPLVTTKPNRIGASSTLPWGMVIEEN